MVILVAENILVIPPWLFVLGRLHPLLLHFPIVLLLLGIMTIFFPRVLKNPLEQYYYGSALLLLGSLFSAVTVIAGFFLYLEGGESSAVLQYHKWTGLAVFWTSSLLYGYFENLEKFVGARQFLASLVGISIIATGHFGASITHGKDFITAPLFGPAMEEVSLEEALVFDHIIQPILENKCVGCHKASKRKGELRLDKVEHILKGGETGPALVPGDADNSLIAQRILLPEEEEHHMPPEGKPQLTPEEKDLITAWISSGASFDQKLLTYDPRAPLFQLASQIFQEGSSGYSFDAVDPEKIKSLNNVYRQVSPLAAGSPALSVSYFGRNNFEVSSLEELLEVRENVVEFNLNNMTLEDSDLETLAGFANLEKLLINFNNIKGEGLARLSSLKALSTLSLAGNSLDEKAVSALSSLTGLRKLYLWETGLTEDQISRLREKLPHTAIETGYVDDGTVYQL
ncbi:MAG TPA: c-type cytochrome domain-containing protein, partial [Cyclobacteriaceae bacterium]|nr:c-type cytochrome domain-containing protein [Cyclobacteriaceae bacterium]